MTQQSANDVTVVQVIRDATYGQMRHAQNLQAIPGVRNIVVAPEAARAGSGATEFVSSELSRRPTPATLKAAWQLAATLRPHSPQIIHSHSVATLPVSMLVARILRLPLVHSPHALPVRGLSGSRFEVGVAMRLIGLAAASGALFVAVSEGERVLLAKSLRGKAPVKLILNPVPDRYLGSPTESHDPHTVLSLSRFWAQKAPNLTLAAFAALKASEPRARLVWAGDGPLLGDCQRYAAALGLAASVDFLGAVPDPLPLLQRANVLLSSSSFEAMPYSILEAMATGTAVVATDIPAHREIDGGAGALALRPANADELANAMSELLSQEETAETQRRAARAVVQANHSINGFARDMVNYYQSVLGRALFSDDAALEAA